MRAFIVIISLFVSACGFTPLYGNLDNGSTTSQELQLIKISPPQGRSGQVFNNHLSDIFYSNINIDEKKYELKFDFVETVERYGFNQDNSTTRETYTVKVVYSLFDLSSGDELLQDFLASSSAYDIVQSDFSNSSAKADALERMLAETAQKLSIKLSRYFRMSNQ